MNKRVFVLLFVFITLFACKEVKDSEYEKSAKLYISKVETLFSIKIKYNYSNLEFWGLINPSSKDFKTAKPYSFVITDGRENVLLRVNARDDKAYVKGVANDVVETKFNDLEDIFFDGDEPRPVLYYKTREPR